MEPRTQLEMNEAVRLRAAANEIIWLGGSDHLNEGVWVWASDGEPIDMVTFWNVGEPHGAREDEDYLCMASTAGQYGDCWGSIENRFVCTIN